jgi:hypothetical protein
MSDQPTANETKPFFVSIRWRVVYRAGAYIAETNDTTTDDEVLYDDLDYLAAARAVFELKKVQR